LPAAPPQIARHTRVAPVSNDGRGLKQLALGHRSLQTTTIYTGPEDMKWPTSQFMLDFTFGLIG